MKRKLLWMLLCLFCACSVLLSSCTEEPETPEVPPTIDSDPEQETPKADAYSILWSFDLYPVEIPYREWSMDKWTREVCSYDDPAPDVTHYVGGLGYRYGTPDALPPTLSEIKSFVPVPAGTIFPENYLEAWENNLSYPIAPGTTITFTGPVYHSYTTVQRTVYDFLESGDTAERSFLLRFSKYYREKDQTDRSFESAAARDAELAAWCAGFLPDGEIVPGIGYVLWRGTAEALLNIANESLDRRIFVCFPEDLAEIHGVTVAQAQDLIDSGDLDMWCDPVDGSPLYGKTPAEIAAYLDSYPATQS